MEECPYCYGASLFGHTCQECGISIYIPARLRYKRRDLADAPEDYEDNPNQVEHQEEHHGELYL